MWRDFCARLGSNPATRHRSMHAVAGQSISMKLPLASRVISKAELRQASLAFATGPQEVFACIGRTVNVLGVDGASRWREAKKYAFQAEGVRHINAHQDPQNFFKIFCWHFLELAGICRSAF
jgi:hypothetical protein